jgi:hypothetical protein
VFEILHAEGFTGGYSGVKQHLRAVRPPPRPTPSLTTPDYAPGEMSESDWSPYEVRFTTGKTAIVQALSYVLVVSKRRSPSRKAFHPAKAPLENRYDFGNPHIP